MMMDGSKTFSGAHDKTEHGIVIIYNRKLGIHQCYHNKNYLKNNCILPKKHTKKIIAGAGR